MHVHRDRRSPPHMVTPNLPKAYKRAPGPPLPIEHLQRVIHSYRHGEKYREACREAKAMIKNNSPKLVSEWMGWSREQLAEALRKRV